VSLHRNKKGMVLDLKKPEGKETFLRMVERCDVVLENYRAGALARLGSTTRRRASAIRASSTARFRVRPGRALSRPPALDLILQAESGMISVTAKPADTARAPAFPSPT